MRWDGWMERLWKSRGIVAREAFADKALRDRRGSAVGAIGITLQMRSWSREKVIDKLVPALSETARALRPLL